MSGGCEIWRVVAEDLRRAPLGSLPAEDPGSEGVRRGSNIYAMASTDTTEDCNPM